MEMCCREKLGREGRYAAQDITKDYFMSKNIFLQLSAHLTCVTKKGLKRARDLQCFQELTRHLKTLLAEPLPPQVFTEVPDPAG